MKKKKQFGRPRIEVDKDLLIELMNIQCTGEEIAGVLRISVDTLERRCKEIFGQTFADVNKIYRQETRKSLRRKQIEVALNGNVAMLIWLGKQYLGQTDKAETDIGFTDHRNVLKRMFEDEPESKS